ncbi:hypothetical protein GGF43_003493 [Coemansia sp. RSA 2618]|nr:hypothetical protein GGF43_003493 [Coemansia sp. RSA 2618]
MESIGDESRITHVCCIGAGYVGGPTSAVMALKCPDLQFTVVDTDAKRIQAWNSDHLPVYEPGLDEIVHAQRNTNLHFSTDVDSAIRNANIVMIAVNTPAIRPEETEGNAEPGLGAAADLRQVEACAQKIAQVANHDTIVVEKSTVPCRTGELIARILCEHGRPHVRFTVLSNPEFLSEGTAVRDLLHPDRVIIGGLEGSDAAQRALKSIYVRWIPNERIVTMGLWSAELTKLASNALLAQRISSINSISAVCEAVGASVTEVSRGCGLDSRIGGQFLRASVGFGGSCFHKDVSSLVWLSESLGLHDVAEYWDQVLRMNDSQMLRFVRRISRSFGAGMRGARIAVWGFAYKGGIGDTRNTPAARICQQLIDQGACLSIYDPKVPDQHICDKLTVCNGSADTEGFRICESMLDAVVAAQAVVILTAWPEFGSADWIRVHELMARPARVFDGHNIIERRTLEAIGFQVTSIGA